MNKLSWIGLGIVTVGAINALSMPFLTNNNFVLKIAGKTKEDAMKICDELLREDKLMYIDGELRKLEKEDCTKEWDKFAKNKSNINR